MRVLKWIVERCLGRGHAVAAPLGLQPDYADLDWRGLDFTRERFEAGNVPRSRAVGEWNCRPTINCSPGWGPSNPRHSARQRRDLQGRLR